MGRVASPQRAEGELVTRRGSSDLWAMRHGRSEALSRRNKQQVIGDSTRLHSVPKERVKLGPCQQSIRGAMRMQQFGQGQQSINMFQLESWNIRMCNDTDTGRCHDSYSSAACRLADSLPRIHVSSLPPPLKFCRRDKNERASTCSGFIYQHAIIMHRASVGRLIAESEPAEWGKSSSAHQNKICSPNLHSSVMDDSMAEVEKDLH